MSWFNPTPEEAAEEYYSAKTHYAQAAKERFAAKNAALHYHDEQNYVNHLMQESFHDKINFEKRIEDIQNLIRFLSDENKMHLLSVPHVINYYQSSADHAGTSYRESIQSPDLSAADLSTALRCESVEENMHSAQALALFQKELARLEQAIQDINARISQLTQMTQELSRKIMLCELEQDKWRKMMLSSAYDMQHFSKYRI